MRKAIFVRLERCLACKTCETACAVEHSQSKSLFGALMEDPRPRPRARVRAAGAYSYAGRCQHCEDAPCIAACRTGVIARDPATGEVVLDHDRCVGCWKCLKVCPFGAVSPEPSERKAYICDDCPERTAQGLDPACVSSCPTRALVFATPDDLAAQRQVVTERQLIPGGEIVPPGVQVWRSLNGGAV